MKPVILVFGPTASGKTSLSLELARAFDGEIISADSMQIYRAMDIGTAKATAQERAEIPHHLIDVCDICDSYSAAKYRQDAIEAIRSIHRKNKLPIVAGGTGLYFDALINTPSYGNTPTSEEIRAKLHERLKAEGAEALHRLLAKIDATRAAKIHANDEKRIVRALEIYYSTGEAPSKVQKKEPNKEFDFLAFYLNFANREDLYRACNERVDQMIEAGLTDEVRSLMENGLALSPTASQAIGYKEFLGYLKQESTLEEAVEIVKRRTRNYAKRQITWFSKMEAIPLAAGESDSIEIAKRHTKRFLKGAPC